jgi:hypothetical protein
MPHPFFSDSFHCVPISFARGKTLVLNMSSALLRITLLSTFHTAEFAPGFANDASLRKQADE